MDGTDADADGTWEPRVNDGERRKYLRFEAEQAAADRHFGVLQSAMAPLPPCSGARCVAARCGMHGGEDEFCAPLDPLKS